MDLDRAMVDCIPRLRRYARALVSDRNRADDLVQECLARAWEKRALWQPGSDLRAWLFTIMHNQYVNDVRRYRSETQVASFDATEHAYADRNAQVEGGLVIRDLAAALMRLPEDQRQVLLLAGLEQMSYAAIAGVLDIPEGTVMSRLSRARERLRVLMADGSESALLHRVK